MCIAGQRAPKLVKTFPTEKLIPQEAKAIKSKKAHAHITVQHNYHDHSDEANSECQSSADLFRASGGSPSFPYKLFDMLSRVEAEGHSHIVSWQPHGRSFVVHKPEAFKSLLSYYFSVTKIASFQRQLNLYGFVRLTRGADRSGYYHDCFLRGKPALMSKIHRMKVKGTGVRARSNPESEPDLWNMPWVIDNSPVPAYTMSAPSTVVLSSACSVVSSSDESTFSEDTINAEPLPLAAPSSNIVTGWGRQFHYLDLGTPSDYSMEMLDEQMMNDADFEQELDDVLNDEGEFDLLTRLEGLVDNDNDLTPVGGMQW